MKRINQNRRWMILTSGLVLTILFAGAVPALADLPEGSPAPDFTLEDTYGTPHTLSDYFGSVIVLAFFSLT